MSRDGSGTHNLPTGQPVETGTTISSTVHNALAADLSAAITQSLSKDGQTTPTANLPMGSFRHTGVGDATARTNYPSVGQLQDDSLCVCISVAGTADAITASLSPAAPALVTGLRASFTAAASNTTTTPTLSLNGLTAKVIVKAGSVPLAANDIVIGKVCYVVYDGTNFILLNPATAFSEVLPVTRGGTGGATAAAARTGLGLVIGTDVLAPNGSAAALTSFPTLNQNTTGSSASCTGNAATATTAAACTGNSVTATDAAFASVAAAIVAGNSYQAGSLGVGAAASGTTGEIRATNNVTAYYSSDRRLKKNIKRITDPLAKVLKLKGVTFDWTKGYLKARGGVDGFFVREHDVGLIAQDVEKVLPEIVADREDGYKAIQYDRVVALLVEAIKELKAEVDELKAGA